MSERIKCTANFYQDEFLHPGETDISKMDTKIILATQWIREQIGLPVTVNNYATGGVYKESGLRELNTKTGAKKSAHKPLPEQGGIGKAVDIKVKGMTAKEVFEFCLKHSDELYAMGIREIEDSIYTPTWTHLSTRGNWERIKIIKP